MKKFITTIVPAFAALLLISCSDNTSTPLSFNSYIYGVTLGNEAEVPIESGSGKYTIHSQDESIVTASYVKAKNSRGNLIIAGKELGETYIIVTDNASDDQVRLKIVVTEPYFSIFADLSKVIIETSNGKPDYYQELEELLLVEYPFGNQDFMIHLMKGSDVARIEQYPAVEPAGIYEGTYDITCVNGEYLLSICFEKEIAETNETKEIKKEYILSGNNGVSLFSNFFNGQITEIPSTRADMAFFDIILTEDFTEKYREIYPDIIYAGLECRGEATINSWLDIKNYYKY